MTSKIESPTPDQFCSNRSASSRRSFSRLFRRRPTPMIVVEYLVDLISAVSPRCDGTFGGMPGTGPAPHLPSEFPSSCAYALRMTVNEG
jgi:hypothetical protein